jgi:hypothetical protein
VRVKPSSIAEPAGPSITVPTGDFVTSSLTERMLSTTPVFTVCTRLAMSSLYTLFELELAQAVKALILRQQIIVSNYSSNSYQVIFYLTKFSSVATCWTRA